MGVPKHLKSSDSRALIWKNGKGTTSEIAIDPEGANFATEPFSWRLSSASVLQSGPFSEFPGYDRYLVLIEGDPICLQFMESGEQVFLAIHQPFVFRGERRVHCELSSGPIRDLNLMVRREQISARFEVIRLNSRALTFPIFCGAHLVFLVSGRCEVGFENQERRFELQAGESLRFDGETSSPLLIRALVDDSVCIRIELSPR